MIGFASMLGAAIEGFAAPMAEADEGDPNASFYSFVAFFSIAVVLYFLLRNMNSRMRRMSFRQQRAGRSATDPQAGPGETAPAATTFTPRTAATKAAATKASPKAPAAKPSTPTAKAAKKTPTKKAPAKKTPTKKAAGGDGKKKG